VTASGAILPRAPVAADRRLSTAQKLALTFEILVAHVRFRRRLKRTGLPGALARARGGTVEGDATDVLDRYFACRVANAVERVLDHVPGGERCLVRSLVLVELLARRNLFTTLVIGVTASGEFGAHAWVEIDGFPLLPPHESKYTRLVQL